MPQFVKDVEEVRQRAIRKIEDGAVTEAYGLDKERTIDILNEALATEIVCVLRYMHHYFMATGVHGKGVADEFKEHADAEREHADQIAERIQQLGGKPDFNPRSLLERSASQYIEGETLADMIKEDLIAERVVIEVYTEMIRYFGDKDPTTRVMIEHILADEEEHASDLSDLLYVVDPRTGEDRGQDPGTDPMSIEHGESGGRNQKRSESKGSSGNQSHGKQDTEEQQMAGNQKKNQGGSQQSGLNQSNQRSSNQQGMSNRDASDELERGGLTGRGNKSLNSSKGRTNERKDGNDTRSGRDNAEMRPSLATRSGRPAAGRGAETQPAHIPGTTGRPKRQRSPEITDTEAGNVYAGEESGTNRAVRVTNANRKRKKVA
jgi:bacterioferritin